MTNSGDLTSNTRGIDVLDDGTAGAVTVMNSGAVTSASTGGHEGIFVRTTRKDAAGTNAGVSVTHSAGDIAVAMGGVGIKAHVGVFRSEGDTEGVGYVAPENEGLVKVAVTGGSVASKRNAVEAINYEAGSVEVTVAAGATLTSTEGFGIDAVLTDVGNTAGTVSVTSAGAVTADAESGIHARNAAGNAVAVTVAVTGGSVTTKGMREHAVEAFQEGTGDAIVNVSDGAEIVSRQNAGILARLRLAGNDEGQVKVTQGGTIAGRTGVHAYVSRDSATTETRTAANQPLIDVTWTGAFSHGTTATVAQDDSDRWAASDATDALTHHRTVEAGKATRYGTPAGIDAQVMSWNDVAVRVAEADGRMIADNAAQMVLLAETGAGSRRAAILAAFKAALGNGDIDVADGVFDAVKTGETSLDDVTDAEIVTYLSTDDADTRTLLRNVLKYSLSEAEMAVLRAAVTDTGLTDAVLDAALPADATNEQKTAYRTAVRGFLNDFNVGDIRVAMNGGSIDSRGDGIRAYYATPNDRNGRIDVTIAAGSTVDVSDGGMAGVYVANAGAMGAGAERILKQSVTVNGMVTGGTDAAVHLVGGGTLTVGSTGKVHAGSSGRAILVNDPGRSVIVINGEVRGGSGSGADAVAAIETTGGGTLTVGAMGKVHAGSSGRAILVNDPGRSVIVIDGEVRGGSGSGADAVAAIETTGGGRIILKRTGRVVLAEGATDAIRADRVTGSDATTDIVLVVDSVSQKNADEAVGRLGGSKAVVGNAVTGEAVFVTADKDGNTTGMTKTAPIENGTIDTSGIDPPKDPMDPDDGTMLCDMDNHHRCRLYEALPSVLLAMNGLPSRDERMSAPRDAHGAWARVETASGQWQAADSTETDLAYDHGRYGARAGVDVAVGEGARLGLSVHSLRGEAEMTRRGGKVELSAVGLGVSATSLFGDGFHMDASAQATRFDVDMTSGLGRRLKESDGSGWALGLEAGRSMTLNSGLSVTPNLGLVWSQASMDTFTDAYGGHRVSMDDAESLVGRLGVAAMAETDGGPRLFGSLDVTHEFSEETEVMVSGTRLAASAETTGVRVGVGGLFDLGNGTSLRGSADYMSSGADNSAYGAGLSMTMSF